MKNIKYILIFLLAGIVSPSCVDNVAPEDAFGEGPNLAAFVSATQSFTVVATGEEFVQNVRMEVKGPSMESIKGPVTATISVDPSSTAIEDVHFRLDQTTVQISPDNNFLALLPITVLTAGIDAPLEVDPVLVLNISTVTGDNNVIAAGKKISVSLLYLCDSQLQGNYIVTINRSDNGLNYVYPETITKTGDGQYRGLTAGHYAMGVLGGNPGFTFFDVCGVLTVPEQNLVDLYSNLLYQDGDSYVLPNGDLHIEYTITFAAGNRKYVADYVKQ